MDPSLAGRAAGRVEEHADVGPAHDVLQPDVVPSLGLGLRRVELTRAIHREDEEVGIIAEPLGTLLPERLVGLVAPLLNHGRAVADQ